MKKRVEWIDIAKFLGIFAIYLGHFGDSAGHAFTFVFAFHVPLFFFLSGCMSNYDNETNIFRFVWKKFKRIMIPFYIFAIVSIVINTIVNNSEISDIKELLLVVGKGCTRNTFFAGALWFLSCLFVMEIIFKIIKLTKFKIIIFFISMIFFLISEFLITPVPIVKPHWIYNLDSMMYYIIFYAIGYCIYPLILKLFDLNTLCKKTIFIILLIISTIYMACLFEGVSICYRLSVNHFTNIIIEVIQPLIAILFVTIISKLLEGVKFIHKIGMETLYLCGNEYIIKTLFPMFISLFGLSIVIDNPIKVYIYTFILIVVNFKIVIPIEKNIIGTLKNKLRDTSK